MSIIIPANSAVAGGYAVDNSLRFNDGSSDYLSRATSDPASSNTTATYSAWIKRGTLGTDQCIWSGSYYSSDNIFQFKFLDTDKLSIYSRRGASTKANLTTVQVFRDVSAWYHIIISIDTTQGTEANRIKCYVNGELASFTGSYPSQNENLYLDSGAGANYYIGRRGDSAEYFDGYIAEFVYVDGTAQANTDLGEFDEDSGIWKPIDVSGLTFGTKGFYLDFEDSSALGADVSGESNNFTVNNLTAIDQSTDTCTTNFATANTLTLSTDATLTEGNLAITYGTASTRRAVFGTVAMFNGKWFWETKITATSQTAVEINLGISNTMNPELTGNALVSNNGFSVSYFTGGYIYIGTTQSQTGLGNLAVNDVIGCALDLTANTIQFYKNGSTLGSAASLTSQTTGELGGGDSGGWTPAWSCSSGGQTFTAGVNFGSPSFAISSGNTDGNGYGNFEYAVPSGYYALNTKNLAEYG